MSETAAMADVVLPVTQWAEETGTMTNLEGRVILREQAVAPPEGVRNDLEVLAGLAARLDSPVPFSTDPEEIFAELGRASAGGKADYAGIDYARIRAEHGVFWPCPAPDHPGTPRMFADSFATADGRARFVPVSVTGPAEVPCDDYPLHLTTGRVLAQYQSGAQTRRIRELTDDGIFVEMHPPLADRIGAHDGEPVLVSTRRGELKAPCADRHARSARTPCSCRSTGSAPTGSPTTRSTRPAGCRSSRSCARRCTRAVKRLGADRRVVGRAWPRPGWWRSWSRASTGDRITVLGDEPHAPYNRILLSAVLEGTHPVDALTLRSSSGTPTTASTSASAPGCSASTASTAT